MEKFYSVAIDGPAGAGKSSMARKVSQRLHFLYLDTGAIYRTVGYQMALLGVSPKDTDRICKYIDEVNLQIQFDETGRQHMLLSGMDVTEQIRSPQMSVMASAVAAQGCVRDYLLDMQRQFAQNHNVVMDGRDIGTVVLPHADVKIFLTASAEVRARRRCKELLEKGQPAEYAEVLADIERRDWADSHRQIAPLKKADDAIELDTSELDIDQSAARIEQIIRERIDL